MTGSDFDGWARVQLAAVEAALERWVPAAAPAGLGEAMRYGVLDGGKRLRPLLVLAACEAVAGNTHAALRAAVAVELIHAYSLVHDDMPCMDNDVLRRGKPTVHVQFGEAQALQFRLHRLGVVGLDVDPDQLAVGAVVEREFVERKHAILAVGIEEEGADDGRGAMRDVFSCHAWLVAAGRQRRIKARTGSPSGGRKNVPHGSRLRNGQRTSLGHRVRPGVPP